MPGDETVDRHLATVLDEVIGAVQATKQVQWSAGSSHRAALEALRVFLLEKADVVAVAEEQIGGRNPAIVSPGGRKRRNLAAEAGGDLTVLVARLVDQLRGLEADIRRKAAETAGTDHAERLTELADGLAERLHPLEHGE